MLDVLSITSVVFFLIALGRVIAWRGLLSPQDFTSMGTYVVNIVLPALVFFAITSRDLTEVFDPAYFLVYLGGSLLALIMGYAVSRRMLRLTRMESSFQAMGISCCNSGFIGYPILHIAIPEVAPTALTLNVVIEMLIMLPTVLILAERSQSDMSGKALLKQIGRRMLQTPTLWALAAGFLVALSGISLPEVITKSTSLIATSSASVSLIVIGGNLPALNFRSIDTKVLLVVLGKLVAMPAAVALFCLLLISSGTLPLPPVIAMAAIIMAAMPSMSLYPILAQSFGEGRSAALAMAVMTVVSFGTLSLLMGGLGIGNG